MAKIWPVYEGKEPTIGAPWAVLPLSVAIHLFELKSTDFQSELGAGPRFGATDRNLWYAGFKHIVVQVGPTEAREAAWKPGFYKSRVKPKEAFGRILRHTLTAKLGEENVERVESEPTTDSQGRDALKVTVVVSPSGVQKLRGGAPLDALVALREQLRDMLEDRIIIIEYATEAELQQDAGP